MSGKDRKPQTSTPVTIEPFDLARVASREALVLVELMDGRTVVAKLADAEQMYVPGEPVPVDHTQAASRALRSRHTAVMLLVGGMTALGRTDADIIAKLMELRLLKHGDLDDPERVRSLKRWRAAYRKAFP